MAKTKLTAGRVREFSTDKPQAFLWDTGAPGLAVRATASGAKAYIYQGKLNGKDLRVTLGDVRAWPLESVTDEQGNEVQRGARQEARRLQSLVDMGHDPREEKRERIAALEAKRIERSRGSVTVGEAWGAYIEDRRKTWGARHLHNHLMLAKAGGEKRTRGRRPGEPDTVMPGPLFPLFALKLAELDAAAVARWLDKETVRGPTQTAQAFRALRAFTAWCADRPAYASITHADACMSKSVREKAPKVGTKEGDSLQREQLRPWFEAVQRIHNPVIAAYLQGLLLTGARREELAGLKWPDVDFQWKSLTIRDKVEGERTIPLTPYMAALLAMLPRRNEWVFSSPAAASGRIQEPRIRHVQALAAAGLPHVSIHGLRRSFGTLAEWVEAPTGVVAQIMGHKPSALAEKYYRRRPLDLLRMWHIRIEAWILEQAGLEQPEAGQQGLRLVEGGKP